MIRPIATAITLLAATGPAAEAQTPTTVTVRVVAHDAKIIGTGVGGARVIIRDVAAGTVLAAGVQEGGTGNTQQIMEQPAGRDGGAYDTEGAAAFRATLALTRPTEVEVIAEAPLGFEHAVQRASKTLLLVPGQDVGGDGLVLILHGFIVELLSPVTAAAGELPVRVRVRMLCGCPFEPGGMWDADRLTVTAAVYDADGLVRSAPLAYAGEPNTFAGTLPVRDVPEGARLVVTASDAGRVNFGRTAYRPLR